MKEKDERKYWRCLGGKQVRKEKTEVCGVAANLAEAFGIIKVVWMDVNRLKAWLESWNSFELMIAINIFQIDIKYKQRLFNN